MSRSHLVLPFALALLVGCGDPYAAPKNDGGLDGSATIGDDGLPIDTGSSIGDTSSPVDVGTAGDPCTTKGATQNGTCGNCGKRLRICNADLKWSDWSACSGEGVCAAGATESTSCGSGGTMTRTCTSSCTWGAYGSCVGGAPSCGSLGATDSAPCGNCGTKARTCTSTGWGPYGACTGEGVCAPGTVDTASCGASGTMSRTCSSSCTWGSYGSCVGGTPTGGCVSGTLRQTFSATSPAMWGCTGKVAWSSASTLCAAGSHVCSAAEFIARHGLTSPNHHYWVSDYLNGSGSATNNCEAAPPSFGTSNFCPATSPMRVCTTALTDPSGNTCTWTGCGYESTTANKYFGGCNDSATAGVLCCN